MSGKARHKPMIPPVATAPAPMYKMYLLRMASASIALISTVDG